MSSLNRVLFITLFCLAIALFILDLMVGDMSLSFADVWGAIVGSEGDPLIREVVIKIRLTKAIVAVIAGAALTTAGLQMQTLFRNPLAEPYLLGVSAGAGLGVSIFLLGAPILGIAVSGIWLSLGVAGAAWIGSMAVMILMMAVSQRIKDIMVILVLGMMLGSAVSAVVMILQYMSNEQALKSFMVWTMGSLGDVTTIQMLMMGAAVVVGLLLSIMIMKPLNMLLLGESYAVTMGLKLRYTRGLIFASTTLLAGTVTAFCGPIGFVGLAVPHIARMLFRSADHRVLIPASILIGVVVMLGCDALSKWLLLPINAITALIGIPIVVVVVMQNRVIGE